MVSGSKRRTSESAVQEVEVSGPGKVLGSAVRIAHLWRTLSCRLEFKVFRELREQISVTSVSLW